ncbi:MAG: sigma-70 family RNA polymerase sigma factor [Candidatus Omnitrophica bacterium]|nr:sigma-70 family RNA polymerase sigma factor [Candidatus Omnitrophota bacterium]MDD5352059.1 sigma-70 family RNA polymerase sigma factor [Candidatus Omnitrophota bacterium]MDD5549657.1 sigma-70 family RNA polymerase sigma factor [Candidatus Omnitrophota bacterium]
MDFKILLEKITPALKHIARKHLFRGFYSEEDLYQEMCLYLWQHYGQGLPIGINEAYVIKGCEFHIQNFLRKGRPRVMLSSLDELITPEGLTLGDILEDKKEDFRSGVENKLTVDEIINLGLSDREKSVLFCLLKGQTVREAAKELGVSHVMILKYKKSIIKKWRKRGYQR